VPFHPIADESFLQSRMPFEDHLGELATRLRRALAGVLLVCVLGITVDFVGMALEVPWLGFGFPALRFIASPAEKSVNDYFRKRLDETSERAKASPAESGLVGRQTFSLGLPNVAGNKDRVVVDVDAVELARVVRLGDLAGGLRRPLSTLNVQEAMITYFKVAFTLALILSSPWVFYQAWAFIAAGLYRHERGRVYVFLPASVGLFLAGIFLCQSLVMPAVVRSLLEFNAWTGFDPELRLREWMGLAVLMPVVFGVSFQAPLLMAFLTGIGVTRSRTYLQYWRQALFGMAVFSLLATPTQDLFTWGYLFLPLVTLYLVGIGVSRVVEVRAEKRLRTNA
jgi:sec-independent protein translocase protein TatC